MSTYRIIEGDVLDGMAKIGDGTVQCCVTSPPYWGLRDYGSDGQIGLEKTPAEFVERLVGVFREVRRVLRDDGVLFLNLGDSYSMSTRGKGGDGKQSTNAGSHHQREWQIGPGLKPKDLVGIPWMVAFALRADGWYLRSDIIWHKPNPMPESVTDRPTKAHEYVFLLSKGQRYFWDADAVKEESCGGVVFGNSRSKGPCEQRQDNERRDMTKQDSRNIRSVWTITTKTYKGAHFATFPPEIPERCIKAGSKKGDLVLDPFAGSGTTLSAAVRLGRNAVGCELNAEYAQLAHERIEKEAGTMFVTRAP